MNNKLKNSSVTNFGLLLCASALMEQIPRLSWRTGLFVLVMMYVAFAKLLSFRISQRPRLQLLEIALIGFVGLSMASIGWGWFGGVTISQWARGVVPFLFLLVYFLIDKNEENASHRLAGWLCWAATVWFARILIELLFLVGSGEYNFGARLTGQIVDSVLPFGLVAMPFMLGGVFRLRFGLQYVMSVAVLSIMFLAGYRSQSVIVVWQIFMIFMFLLRSPKRVMQVSLLFLLVLVLASKLGAFDVLQTILDRFQNTTLAFEASRISELDYAIDQLRTHLLLGRGIGWQVPAEVTFKGVLWSLRGAGMEIPDSAGYVHSLTGYLLMDTGLVGFGLYYWGFLLGGIKSTAAMLQTRTRQIGYLTTISLFSILLYCQVQAAFRLIQVNLLLVGLLAIAVSIRRLNERSRQFSDEE